MKKFFISILILVSLIDQAKSQSQDLVVLKHTNYTTTYSKTLHYPILVEWWETKASNGCATPLPRKDQFAPDPALPSETKLQPDYDLANKTHKEKGLKGFDRGHMSPAASNECGGDKVLTECFYFSNMAAQYHALNAGDWKTLETLERDLALKNDSVHIWAGSIGVAEKFGTTSVPTQCWKVVYIVKTKEYMSFVFDNKDEKQTGLESHKVDLDYITKLTGFKFKK